MANNWDRTIRMLLTREIICSRWLCKFICLTYWTSLLSTTESRFPMRMVPRYGNRATSARHHVNSVCQMIKLLILDVFPLPAWDQSYLQRCDYGIAGTPVIQDRSLHLHKLRHWCGVALRMSWGPAEVFLLFCGSDHSREDILRSCASAPQRGVWKLLSFYMYFM